MRSRLDKQYIPFPSADNQKKSVVSLGGDRDQRSAEPAIVQGPLSTLSSAGKEASETFRRVTLGPKVGPRCAEPGQLGGSGVEDLPFAQGLIPVSGDQVCIRLPARSLPMPPPVSLPLSMSFIKKKQKQKQKNKTLTKEVKDLYTVNYMTFR